MIQLAGFLEMYYPDSIDTQIAVYLKYVKLLLGHHGNRVATYSANLLCCWLS